MSRNLTRLTVHFGERTRSGGVLLAERLMSLLHSGGLETAVLIRGGEGFGPKHGLRTSDRLTLSEDLPMVAIALDSVVKVRPVAEEIRALLDEGLVTVESAEAIGSDGPGGGHPDGHPGGGAEGEARLTVWTRRRARIGGLPAHVWVLNCLKQHGARAGITLLGVDGIADGARQRAGFFSANRDVPLLVVGVVSRGALAATGTAVSRRLPEALLESVDLVPSGQLSDNDAQPPDLWRLSLYGGGTGPGTGIRQQGETIRLLRREGAHGATGYFGLHGFVGGEDPHGDSLRSLRRRVPALTEVVDTAANCRRWLRDIERIGAGPALITLSPVRPLSRPAGPA